MTRLCPALFIDQYGQHLYAGSLKELREKSGGGRVSKMFIDKKPGDSVYIGYVIGARWFSAFRPVEIPAWASPTLRSSSPKSSGKR